MANHAIVVGSLDSGHILMGVSGYQHPGSNDKVEANRLKASLSMSAGAWSGRLKNVDITTNELLGFRRQLEQLIKDRKGEASFEPLDAYLVLRISRSQDFIEASGLAFDQPDGHNALAFNWPLQPEDLSSLLKQLKELENAFPAVK